jgi:putative transposase
LASLPVQDAPCLYVSTTDRLKKTWEDGFSNWNQRRLAGKRYVYIWVAGIHFNVRLEQGRQRILLIMGATEGVTKELIAVGGGVHESDHSRKAVLLDIQARSLKHGPKVALDAGALGFWTALPEVQPDTRPQAEAAFDRFGQTSGVRFPKALECLVKDKDLLLAVYDFPAKHRLHPCSTNPIQLRDGLLELNTQGLWLPNRLPDNGPQAHPRR